MLFLLRNCFFSANISNMRAYIAGATYTHERTKQMSYSSAMQSLGFIVGPIIQAGLTPLRCQTHDTDQYFALDMYTLAG